MWSQSNSVMNGGMVCPGWAKAVEVSKLHTAQTSWVAKPHVTIQTPSSIHDQELPKVHLLLEFFSTYFCLSVCLSVAQYVVFFWIFHP